MAANGFYAVVERVTMFTFLGGMPGVGMIVEKRSGGRVGDDLEISHNFNYVKKIRSGWGFETRTGAIIQSNLFRIIILSTVWQIKLHGDGCMGAVLLGIWPGAVY
jgi:hypothetical protein